MKKILFLILLVGATATLLANPKQQTYVDQEKILLQNQQMLDSPEIKYKNINDTSFNYSAIGGSIASILPTLLPGFDIGIGHREKYNSFAIDSSLRLSTIVLASNLGGELKFLKYFDNTYVGGGLSAGALFFTVTPAGLVAKPFITVGKENKKKFS